MDKPTTRSVDETWKGDRELGERAARNLRFTM